MPLDKETRELIEEFFSIDEDEVKELSKKNEEELETIIEEIIVPTLEEEGEESIDTVIIPQVLEYLRNTENNTLIEFLGLDYSEEKNDNVLDSIEFYEKQLSFHDRNLTDDSVNDLEFSLLGSERIQTTKGEKFIKIRPALLPTKDVAMIMNVIKAQFNRANFLSQKDPETQAKIITGLFDSILNILLSIPLKVLPIDEFRQIVVIIESKLLNLVGLNSDKLRQDILTSVERVLRIKEDAGDDGKAATKIYGKTDEADDEE